MEPFILIKPKRTAEYYHKPSMDLSSFLQVGPPHTSLSIFIAV